MLKLLTSKDCKAQKQKSEWILKLLSQICTIQSTEYPHDRNSVKIITYFGQTFCDTSPAVPGATPPSLVMPLRNPDMENSHQNAMESAKVQNLQAPRLT